MATRDEQIRVSITRGKIDPEVNSLLTQLGKSKDRTVSVSIKPESKSAISDKKESASISLKVDSAELEKEVTGALSAVKKQIQAFNDSAVLKIKVESSALSTLISDLEKAKSLAGNLEIKVSSRGGGGGGNGGSGGSGGGRSPKQPRQPVPTEEVVRFKRRLGVGETTRAESITRRKQQFQDLGPAYTYDPAFKKSLLNSSTRRSLAAGVSELTVDPETGLTMGVDQFEKLQSKRRVSRFAANTKRKASLNDPSKLYGQFAEVDVDPVTGLILPKRKLESLQRKRQLSVDVRQKRRDFRLLEDDTRLRGQFTEVAFDSETGSILPSSKIAKRRSSRDAKLNDRSKFRGQVSDLELDPDTGRLVSADKLKKLQDRKNARLNDPLKLRGQFESLVFDPNAYRSLPNGTVVQGSFVSATSFARRQKTSALSQAREALRYQRIEKEFFGNATIGELGSQIFGGKEARLRAKLKQAQELEVEKGIPGLAQKLTSGLTAANLNEKTPLLSGARLKNPAALAQVAFGGVFGGGAGLAAAGIGAALGGAPGALLAGTIQQAVSGLVDPILEEFKKHESEFKEAGEAYSRSILGIASVLQANTRVFSGSRQLGESENIGSQIKLQEKQATEIQLAARAKLSQIGVGGQTEATAVQGIVSALASRGINANASQVAQISESIVGAVVAQRPQLLDNTGLFLRDIQDYLGGGPQAKRTVISQLAGLRSAGTGVQSGQSADDIIKALRPAQAFAQAVRESDSTASLLSKQQGAEDQLRTLGGEEYYKALQPALKEFVSALQSDEFKQAAQNLGSTLGQFANITLRASTAAAELANAFSITAGEILGNLPQIKTLITSFLGGKSEHDRQLQETEDLFKAGSTASKVTSVADSALRSAGYEDILSGESSVKFGKSAQSRINALRIAEFGYQQPSASKAEGEQRLPDIFAAQVQAYEDRSQERTRLLQGVGVSGGLASIGIEKDYLDKQAEANDKRLISLKDLRESVTNSLSSAQSFDKQIADVKAQGITFKENGKDVPSGGLAQINQELAGLHKQRNNLISAAKAESERINQGVPRSGNLTEADLQAIDEKISAVEFRKARIGIAVRSLENQKKEAAPFSQFTPQQVANVNSEIAAAQDKSLEIEIKKVSLTEKQASLYKDSIARLSSAFDTSTSAGAAGLGKESQKRISDLISSLNTNAKSLNTSIDVEKGTQLALKSRIGPLSQEDKTTIDESSVRQKVFEGLKEQNDISLASARFDEARIRDLEASSTIRALEKKGAGFNSETEAGQSGLLGNAADINKERLGIALLGRQDALLALAKNPEDKVSQQLAENYQAEVSRAQVEGDKLSHKQSLQPLARASAVNELASISVKLKETLQSEISQRHDLNEQLKSSASALREFGANVAAKTSGKESEIFSLAQRYKELGGELPSALDLNEEQLREVNKNAIGAQLGASLASVGRSDLAPQVANSQTGLISTLGNGSFQQGIQAEQVKLEDAVRKTAIELEKLPFAIEDAVLAINKRTAELKYYLSDKGKTGEDSKGPVIPAQGPVNIKLADRVKETVSKAFPKTPAEITPPTADEQFDLARRRNGQISEVPHADIAYSDRGNPYLTYTPPVVSANSTVDPGVVRAAQEAANGGSNSASTTSQRPGASSDEVPTADKIAAAIAGKTLKVEITGDQVIGPSVNRAINGGGP